MISIEKHGPLVIFTYKGEEDPVLELENAILDYVSVNSIKKYTKYVDYNMDNPWEIIIKIED